MTSYPKGHPLRNVKQDKPGATRIRSGRNIIEVPDREFVSQALMVSYGGGVDSTAMLVLLHKQGIRPDAILFANVGCEKDSTYAYIRDTMNPWLQSVGFPQITVVHKNGKHRDLYQNCVENETLPSLAFGGKSCSLKWKVSPMDQWTNGYYKALQTWARGMKVLKLIGYDASGADMKRFAGASSKNDPRYDYRYPLIENGISRPQCKELIREAGLPVPQKSSCFFCPAMKADEIVELGHDDFAKLAAAIHMEDVYRSGKNARKPEPVLDANGNHKRYTRGPRKGQLKYTEVTEGLGRNRSWRSILEAQAPDLLAQVDEHNAQKHNPHASMAVAQSFSV